ncbi:FAD-dependent oxidoreductase [Achlya hypogyna]|uniref:FAD-dependent oxidoreductase n=1 Tax=Achlya hypogyna TaxID=1202772 RepID=A0A1V9YKV0_ACHHY|nr:FAD-dependent oxidoreductase [Achlya hypogyna]
MAPAECDVVVVGGGVVGTAIFRELSLRGYSAVLLEKNAHLASGASSGNSGIACTGYDAPRGSLEQRCIRRSIQLNAKVHADLGLPSNPSGSLVVAWTAEELIKLPAIVSLNHELGDTDVKIVDAKALYELEPDLAPGALGAVLVPGEIVVEPWLIPIAYAHHGLANGGRIFTKHCVASGSFSATTKCWRLVCTNGAQFDGRCVINCAGNFGDLVEAIHTPKRVAFEMQPRKGQFLVYGGSNAPQLNHVLQPVPSHRTKGIFMFKTLYGQIIVGPTAEDQLDREHPTTDAAVLASLKTFGERILPGLAATPIVGAYAGLRPATQFRDYQIAVDAAKCWITVAGIRSTGVTASLGIAEYVVSNLLPRVPDLTPKAHAPIAFRLPAVATMAQQMHASDNTLLQPGLQGPLRVDHAITRLGWLSLSARL